MKLAKTKSMAKVEFYAPGKWKPDTRDPLERLPLLLELVAYDARAFQVGEHRKERLQGRRCSKSRTPWLGHFKSAHDDLIDAFTRARRLASHGERADGRASLRTSH